jgi:hypothetical protein
LAHCTVNSVRSPNTRRHPSRIAATRSAANSRQYHPDCALH